MIRTSVQVFFRRARHGFRDDFWKDGIHWIWFWPKYIQD